MNRHLEETMPRSGPRRDRHELYEESVQCPEADIRFFDRIYREWNGRLPRVLREDFCGTAAIAAQWVRWRKDNEAIGIDLDGPTLAWGKRVHIDPLGEKAKRLQIIQADVRSVTKPRADVIAALNFSYFVFHEREALREYFRAALKGLAPNGVFILDIFGGWEAQKLLEETRRKTGFTYVWDQDSFDPITHLTRFYIHFRFKDGTEMKRAFTYDWRLWTIAEVREALAEAGFGKTAVYWEGTDPKTRRGSGVFRRTAAAISCPGWIAYIVAGR
jgi:SAM-dependent methyltransferase